jgi:diguanylate cyclase
MVETNQVNPLLIHFCRELTIQIESLSNLQTTIRPTEFSELVANATHEVLDAYVSGEFDLLEYRNNATEEYKEIARRSIDSYSVSNTIIEEISEKHAALIEETASSSLIDFGKISEKFNAIQDHLSDEVTRANDVIHTLLEQVKTLEMKTSLDPLTKAYNRYALQEHLKVVLEKEKLDFDIFLLMIDVDDFKLINDRFGHIAGDKVLIFITKLFKKALRDGDRVYRFGGEEFIILLNRTDSAGAQLVAERLLNLCRINKPLFQNQQIPVTLSIGISKITDGDTIDEIINRSDVALYRAKKNGKDRIEVEF